MSASVEPEVRAVSTPTRQQQAPSPAECLQNMLAANFDAVSVPAALTLAKYLLNILLYPEDQRFRSVNTENKVFTSKVLPAKGAAQFLQSVGFRAHPASSALQLPAAAADGLSAEQLRLLGEGWDLLQAALTELGVPEQDRPVEASVDAAALRLQREARRSQQVQLEQAVAFDPFRAHIVRAAPQVRHLLRSFSSTAHILAFHTCSLSGKLVQAPALPAPLHCPPQSPNYWSCSARERNWRAVQRTWIAAQR